MGRDKTKKSTVREIVAEIAHDLGIDKKLVRQVLILTFKEIALTLILRGRPDDKKIRKVRSCYSSSTKN